LLNSELYYFRWKSRVRVTTTLCGVLFMGATQVTVTIRNPADPERAWEGLFLVDTGATDSLVPRQHLEAIGLQPKGQRVYELADGSELRMDITVGQIEFMGEFVGGTIIFGDENAEPLLGVTALESVGIEVDPVNQRLKRLPAVRLKGMKRTA
jgi:clan AA aspartic protease